MFMWVSRIAIFKYSISFIENTYNVSMRITQLVNTSFGTARINKRTQTSVCVGFFNSLVCRIKSMRHVGMLGQYHVGQDMRIYSMKGKFPYLVSGPYIQDELVAVLVIHSITLHKSVHGVGDFLHNCMIQSDDGYSCINIILEFEAQKKSLKFPHARIRDAVEVWTEQLAIIKIYEDDVLFCHTSSETNSICVDSKQVTSIECAIL